MPVSSVKAASASFSEVSGLRERVVGDERDRPTGSSSPHAGERRPATHGGDGGDGGAAAHDAAPGTMTVTMPCSTDTVTGGVATWLLTPRPTSGGEGVALERPAGALDA